MLLLQVTGRGAIRSKSRKRDEEWGDSSVTVHKGCVCVYVWGLNLLVYEALSYLSYRSEVIPLLQSTKNLMYTRECKRKHVESGSGCEGGGLCKCDLMSKTCLSLRTQRLLWWAKHSQFLFLDKNWAKLEVWGLMGRFLFSNSSNAGVKSKREEWNSLATNTWSDFCYE